MAQAFTKQQEQEIIARLKRAAAMLRGLMLTLSLQPEIGPRYPEVPETMVYGACQRLFPR